MGSDLERVSAFPFLLSQLESTLREKSQQLESLQEMKITLEEQLKKETAAKVIFLLVIKYKSSAKNVGSHLACLKIIHCCFE